MPVDYMFCVFASISLQMWPQKTTKILLFILEDFLILTIWDLMALWRSHKEEKKLKNNSSEAASQPKRHNLKTDLC